MKKLFTMFILFASLCYGQGQLPDDVLRNLLMTGRQVSIGPDVGTPYVWWKMTGTDTNTTSVIDSMSLTKNAMASKPNVATGPALVTTNATYSWYSFNGSSQYFQATNAPYFSPSNLSGTSRTQMTVSAWFYYPKYIAAQQPIFSKHLGPTTREWSLYILASDVATVSNRVALIVVDGAANYARIAGNAIISTTAWHHVAATWNGGTNVQLWLDGTLQSSGDLALGGTFTTNKPTSAVIQVGTLTDAGGVDRFFTGMIDEPLYYTNLLTATQIQNLYNGRNQP